VFTFKFDFEINLNLVTNGMNETKPRGYTLLTSLPGGSYIYISILTRLREIIHLLGTCPAIVYCLTYYIVVTKSQSCCQIGLAANRRLID